MTLANQITCCRIALVPVFVGLGVAYGRCVEQGQDHTGYYLGTLASFAVISSADGVDGYIARNWNQRTRLGAILDPLADKLLMLSALLMLSLSGWPMKLPLWLAGVVIARDVLSSLAAAAIQWAQGRVLVRPHWTGKLATVLQIASISWSLLGWAGVRPVAAIAALITVLSGGVYLVEGTRQLFAPSPPSA